MAFCFSADNINFSLESGKLLFYKLTNIYLL